MPPKSNHETRGIIFSEIQYLPLTSLKIERGHFLQGVAVIYFTCWVAKITLAVIVIGVYSSEILRKREKENTATTIYKEKLGSCLGLRRVL